MQTSPKKTFVFFHIGSDISMPQMLVNSIRWTNPNSEIIQCTDFSTPLVPGITKKLRMMGDSSKIMSFRIQAFEKAKITCPAIYLDTDMLVIKNLEPSELLNDQNVLLCKRNYTLNGSFIGKQKGVFFDEYDKKPLGQVFPFVACTTVTKDYTYWKDLNKTMSTLDDRFHIWYGDQEAMKQLYFKNNGVGYGFLNESEFGYLPGEPKLNTQIKIIHFKGNRKDLMLETYLKLKNSANS